MAVHRLTDVASTQNEARTRAVAHEPTWVIAHTQHAGRGRQSRRWLSEAGDLIVSCAWTLPQAVLPLAPLLAGEALWRAVEDTGADLSSCCLKWPNDLLRCESGDEKLAGILVEADARGLAVTGWGVNLVNIERPLDPDPGYRAGSLAVSADRLFAALERRYVEAVERASTDPTADAQRLLTFLRDGPFRLFWGREGWILPEQTPARTIDVDATGGLIVETRTGERRTLRSGEFKLKPRA